MTEEEYFRKTYPDSCYGDKPLSPYWDFFQDGVEFGERQSEQKIGELKRKLEKETAQRVYNFNKAIEWKEKHRVLKKENAELKHNKKTVVHLADCLEEKMKERIEELEQQIEKMKCCGNCSHRRYWGNELGCNLDLDKQFECDNNNKKYWEFREE